MSVKLGFKIRVEVMEIKSMKTNSTALNLCFGKKMLNIITAA